MSSSSTPQACDALPVLASAEFRRRLSLRDQDASRGSGARALQTPTPLLVSLH
jgi:hypothetical protein